MKPYTLEDYKKMSDSFNKMAFIAKIETLQKTKDLLTLASDGNWWGVRVKDKKIQEQLEEDNCQFQIEKEWDCSEMCDLVFLLGIENTDF